MAGTIHFPSIDFKWLVELISSCSYYICGVLLCSKMKIQSETCRLCGKRLGVGGTNPCSTCLKNEPADLLKRFNESDKEALRAELGLPLSAPWRVFNEDAAISVGKEWKGYKLELLGVELGRYSEWPIPPEGLRFYEQIGAIARQKRGAYNIIRPSLLLPFTCIPDPENPDLIIKLCRIRAFYKSSPLYSEMRPRPLGVRRVAIHGLEHKHTQKDREKVFKGLALLRAAVKRGGRRKGSRSYSEADFRRRAPLAYQDFYNRTGKYPNGALLAIEMHLSRSAFFANLKAYNLTINDIRALAKE
jgi:hypothetical protein